MSTIGTTTRIGLLSLFLAILAACATPPDAHVPDFARKPYEPFGRETAVAIALREWRLFGQPVQDETPNAGPANAADQKPERAPGLWQRVGEYWWLGQSAGNRESAWTGKHDEHGNAFPAARDSEFAWSAAFISYVMRIAGAGRRFPYSGAHADYINAAREASLGRLGGAVVWAERPDLYAPQLGDLICNGRGAYAGLRFEDLPAGHFYSHCDIVVGVEPGQLSVIGGNVDDAVTMKHVPTTSDGKLAGPDRIVVDDRHPWFVVIRVLYDR